MTTTHDAAVALATEVVRFLAEPNLDRIRPDCPGSNLYLSWADDDRLVPHLALVVTLDPVGVAEAAQLLTDRGVTLEIRDHRPVPVIPMEGDPPVPVGPLTEPGRWFSVPLVGPTYAGLLAEDALRAAERSVAGGDWDVVLTCLDGYRECGGSPDDPRYLRLAVSGRSQP